MFLYINEQLGRLSAIFDMRNNLNGFLNDCPFATVYDQSPYEKGSTLRGANSFILL